MPLNYDQFFRKIGVVAVGTSLMIGGLSGCSLFGEDSKGSKSKAAVTKKVDKNKRDENKKSAKGLNEKDFAAITDNAIQGKDKDVTYVLEELDKSKVHYKDKVIASNLQNGDETSSRVIALFDKETSDKNLNDTAKDNIIAAITDGSPQPTLNGDHFAFGNKDDGSSVASLGDILPPSTETVPPVELPTNPGE
ncbi:hemagglutinin, partial [Bacillus sp. AFS018417]|uniref:hemagglutinin n=1 Tax=Bacillus sp. AFS018417 TaxID=2033491 RepID=UPI000BF39758